MKIADLQVNTVVEIVAVLKDARLASFRNKDGSYLAAKIVDKSGDIDVKMWDGGEEAMKLITPKGMVIVRGKVDSFNGATTITASSIAPYEGAIDHADFLPCYEGDVTALYKKLDEVIASIKDEELSKLVDNILNDPEIGKQYRIAPAAISIHGAYLYGLVEHIMQAVDIAENLAKIYTDIDRDLLISGVLLHDIGKIVEYSYDLAIDQTLEGGLIGHTVIGDRLINERAKELGISSITTMKLSHLILSHHGLPEYGTAIYPKTLEAIALHCVDYVEAKLTRVSATLSKVDDNIWSDFDRYDNHKWIRVK